MNKINLKDIAKERHDINIEILNYLKEFIDKYPEIRFNQALICLNILEYGVNGVVDPFYVESRETLNNIKQSKISQS